MATEILMPKLGLTMTEGLIQKWLVQVGDTVTSGQPLLEISSEKLTSEVESPASGVVLQLNVRKSLDGLVRKEKM